MLAEERFALILNLLAEKRTATVQELCEALNASESTIRRDLTELARQGRLNKVHGGATLPDGQFLADEPTMAAKEALAVGQKRSIAQAAADLIRAEDFIYIDAGTTTLAMVRALSGPALEAHYVTNGIAHARLLAQKSCHVCVPGGLLRPRTEAIIGAAAITALQQFNFTKAFIGANGVALNVGFTTPDPEEAAVKAVAVRRGFRGAVALPACGHADEHGDRAEDCDCFAEDGLLHTLRFPLNLASLPFSRDDAAGGVRAENDTKG